MTDQPKTDWVHITDDERAARTRLAKLFCWNARAEDAILDDDTAVEIAIRRWRAFVGRPRVG